MSTAEQTIEKKVVLPTIPDPTEPSAQAEKMGDDAAVKEPNTVGDKATRVVASKTSDAPGKATETAEKPANDKPSGENEDSEMSGTAEAPANSEAKDNKETEAPAPTTAVAAALQDKSRRKSAAEYKGGKKLNKKGSKARITNLDAEPGNLYTVKLKGYPPWPAIICDEEMIPTNIRFNRPVTAKRVDGTYREDFADGGRRAHDRSFAVMYLYTNEFGWVPNTNLQELTPQRAGELVTSRMRKDLQTAYKEASQGHDVAHYKQMLLKFDEERLAKEKAKQDKAEAVLRAKAEAVLTAKAKAQADPLDEDFEMGNAEETRTPATESKKRKAETDAATPQQSDSVKKPKIKITSSKPTNGTASPNPPKAAKTAKPPSAKPKTKKAARGKKAGSAATRDPEMTPEQLRQHKVREIMFVRHKLQKGLLAGGQGLKAEEMEPMSDYLAKLELVLGLTASIIRATKIHKVLKAILRLESIPKEEEFNFKTRSQSLLDKWNKLLADARAAIATATASTANGTNGVAGKTNKERAPKQPGPNGVSEGSGGKIDKAPSNAGAEKAAEESKEAKAVEAST